MTEDNQLKKQERERLNKSVKIDKDWKFMELFPTISAYTTAYNCIKNKYPLFNAIKSFSWCDEIVVVDGGSDDGTLEKLYELQEDFPNLQVYEIPIDWEAPGKDGVQKAMSRAMCTSDITIQFDADEFCIGDPVKWKKLSKDISADILELPVLEPFGDITKLRLNEKHNPVKWRIFLNRAEITHGIPKKDRLEKDGKVFSKGMSDGCFPIDVVKETLYPSKMTQEAKKIKKLFNEDKEEYKLFIETILAKKSPAILHVGHVDLKQKINLFLSEWRKWWAGLYDKDPEDISMYFQDLKLDEITEDIIDKKVKELTKKTPVIKIEALKEFEDLTNESEQPSV